MFENDNLSYGVMKADLQYLKMMVRSRSQAITNVAELETALQEEWDKISQSQVMALIESMPQRIEAVITNNGWPTKY